MRLRRFPLCGTRADGQRYPAHSACTRDNRIVAATCTDHIEPHRGDQQKFWTPLNHQSLCTTCHNTKTAKEDGGFGRGGGEKSSQPAATETDPVSASRRQDFKGFSDF
jgi:5-methylcytosine-specific restriction endonuclease McrA